MKILVVSQYFYPEQFRINDICFELVKRGHNVTVLTGLPNYPEGKIYPGYENKGNTSETINGVNVIRCKLRPRYRGTKNLVFNYFSFVRQANRKIKTLPKDFDFVYVYGVSPVTQALPAIKYKKKNNTKIVYYCCDLWPEAVRGAQNGHKHLSKHCLIYKIAKSISKYVYRNVDLIALKCEDFGEYLSKECKICSNKMAVLYEHAETNYLSVKEKPFDNGVIDFFFLGNIGKAQKCDLIIKAASLLKETTPYLIHFVGDGSNLASLKQMVDIYQLTNKIVFHPRCTQEETIKYYNLADVCLLTLSNDTATGLTPPAKLFGYMASCRPIIASIDGSATRIINEAKCGFCVNSGDYYGLSKLMQSIIDGKIDLKALGNNGRLFFVNNFTIDNHLERLIHLAQNIN